MHDVMVVEYQVCICHGVSEILRLFYNLLFSFDLIVVFRKTRILSKIPLFFIMYKARIMRLEFKRKTTSFF